MPTYSYKCRNGHLTDRMYSMDNAKTVIRCPECKGLANRDFTRIKSSPPSCWPLASTSMGVHPDQVGEAISDSRDRGVPTHFDTEGRAIFRDRKHRQRFLKAYQAHDKDGGYSD